jgi:hypothetical protein
MLKSSVSYLLLSALLVSALAQIQLPGGGGIRILPPAANPNNRIPIPDPPVAAPVAPPVAAPVSLPVSIPNIIDKILPPPSAPGPCASCSATFNVFGNDAVRRSPFFWSIKFFAPSLFGHVTAPGGRKFSGSTFRSRIKSHHRFSSSFTDLFGRTN